MMIIDVVNATTRKIEDALSAMRHRMGAPAAGKVLTLVIVTNEAGQHDALRTSSEAAREHPCRIIVVISRESEEESRLDAEIHMGDAGPGEAILLRLYGPLVRHAESPVLPLLLPDAPVVTWWPCTPPLRPSAEPLGAPAQRRITDTAGCAEPLGTLERLAEVYRPGDVDLAWTRITPWRSLLAAALDQPYGDVTAMTIEASPGNPSAALLGSWLAGRLGVPAALSFAYGPGITDVRLATTAGLIRVTRPDGRVATLSRPGQPERQVTLHRRPGAELIAEELRRLQPDEIYREALQGWSDAVIVRAAVGM